MWGEFLQEGREVGTVVHQGFFLEILTRGAVEGEWRNQPTYGLDFIDAAEVWRLLLPDTDAMTARPAADGEVLWRLKVMVGLGLEVGESILMLLLCFIS